MNSETILMPLLGEGTDVWRPVEAEPLSYGRYRVLGDMPEDETWAFASGSTVDCVARVFPDGETRLVAVGSPPTRSPAAPASG